MCDVEIIQVLHACSDVYNTVLSFNAGEWTVDTLTKLPEGMQPQFSVHELAAAEKAVRNDPKIQKLAADIGESALEPHTNCKILAELRVVWTRCRVEAREPLCGWVGYWMGREIPAE